MANVIFTARKRSLGQGNVFTPVFQSFCSQGGGVMSLDSTPPKKRAVRILLECFLVSRVCALSRRTWKTEAHTVRHKQVKYFAELPEILR